MPIERHKPAETVIKLRQVEVIVGQGMPSLDVIREISITDHIYYR
jgi:putative transposase